MLNTPFIKVTRKSPNPMVSGIMTVAAVAGLAVQFTNTNAAASLHDDGTTLAKAAAPGAIYFLNREVINATEIPLADVVFGNNEVNSVLINNPVDVFQALEIEAEGGDTDADGKAVYVKTASTGAIADDTAADTLLTLVAGQWALITDQNTQPVCGRLLKQLTPVTAGNVRIAIEVYPMATLDTDTDT